MDHKKLTDRLAVCGQISPEDVKNIEAAGYKTIICNRPDGEKPEQPAAAEIRQAAEAAGIAFHHNPISPDNVTPEAVAEQGRLLSECEGPALAYCGSGKRATVLWALANPEGKSVDDRLRCAAEAGHDLEPLRPRL